VSSPSLRESELRVGGIRSPLVEAGPEGASEAVVFVHGNPGSARDWDDLVRRAGEFARAVAIDMPGFGRAEKPRDFDYTVSGYAAHIERVRRALGIERVHLVLHDFGGPFGLAWAAANPDAFASATLINTGVLIGYRWHVLARIWRTPGLGELLQATTNRPAWRLLLRRGNPRGLPRELVDRMYDDYDRATRRAVLKLYRATDVGGASDVRARQLAATLHALDRPALVLWGAADPYIPVEQAERNREAFPSAVVQVMPDSGHWPFADDPEGAAAHVIPFLRQMAQANRKPADHLST